MKLSLKGTITWVVLSVTSVAVGVVSMLSGNFVVPLVMVGVVLGVCGCADIYIHTHLQVVSQE